jgi:hypothetical protein
LEGYRKVVFLDSSWSEDTCDLLLFIRLEERLEGIEDDVLSVLIGHS